jgi:hypothetical protein
MTLPEALRRVRARIDTPEKWCKGKLAEDGNGKAIQPYPPTSAAMSATSAIHRWSLWGAVLAERFPVGIELAALRTIEEISGSSMQRLTWSLTTTHADVMQLLDRCIERAEREGVTA